MVPKHQFLRSWLGVFIQANGAKYSNFCVINTTTVIPTEVCTMIKTSKYSLRVVPECTPQIQGGGLSPSWKKVKNRHIAATIWLILTIYTSYGVFLCNDVPFRGHVDIASHLGIISPKTYIPTTEPASFNRDMFAHKSEDACTSL